MHKTLTAVHVVGHSNPDTDAIASAIGYAWLLSERDRENAIAARAGRPNTQAAWMLQRFGLPTPELLTDAAPTFGRISRRLPPVSPTRPILEAWRLASSSNVATPVVDDAGQPVGLFTSAALFGWLSSQIEDRADLAHISVARMLETPAGEVIDRDAPKFPLSMRVREARQQVLRLERDDFWTVRDDGTYYGVCRTSDILNPPRLRIILVDHNEAGQSISSIEEADLIEVIDHHRLGNPKTAQPIPFMIDIVGSTSTLIAERILAAGMVAPAAIGGALLSGVLSDTLVLSSPTTTSRDHRIVEQLSQWADIADWQAFGHELLTAGAGLASRDLDEAVASDLKVYDVAGFSVGIAQVEVSSLRELQSYQEPLIGALARLSERRGFELAMLMVTDIVRNTSRLLVAGDGGRVRNLPYQRLADGTFDMPGVVSRKKQLLPNVLALLESA